MQTVLLRPELHVQLFRADPDSHLARALHGHQAPDVEPSFRRDAGSPRGGHRQRVAAQRRLLAAVAGRLRYRHDRHCRLLYQHSAAQHSRLRHGQLLRPLRCPAGLHEFRLRPHFYHAVALQHDPVTSDH